MYPLIQLIKAVSEALFLFHALIYNGYQDVEVREVACAGHEALCELTRVLDSITI